jgi:hypothetical protein
VSIKANCPRCGHDLSLGISSDGGRSACSHCGTIISEAVMAHDGDGGAAQPEIDADRFSAMLLSHPSGRSEPSSLICPRCGNALPAATTTGAARRSCPYCLEINVEAMITHVPPPLRFPGALQVGQILLALLCLAAAAGMALFGVFVQALDQSLVGTAFMILVDAGAIVLVSVGVWLLRKGDEPEP